MSTRDDLVVVGASFAGLACARAAARVGLRVRVIEKKSRAGDKLHTTGILVKDAIDQLPWLQEVPPALVRTIRGVRLYAPNLQSVDLQAPGYYFWATDTPALLDWMVARCVEEGVQFDFDTVFEQARPASQGWVVACRDREPRTAAYLVGADGPHSRVAKVLGLSSNVAFLFGIEHEYTEARLAPDRLHCFIDRRLAPGYIGWGVAGVGVQQVGLARRVDSRATSACGAALAALREKIAPHVDTRGLTPASVRAGMIPCGGTLARVARERALLVGDAAGMVSPVTAGGIHTALHHGEAVGAAIAGFLRGQGADPAGDLPATYPRFRTKKVLRWLFDRVPSDPLFNVLLHTRALRRAAEIVYFHRRGR